MNNAQNYHLYVLLCDQKILYTGIALDPKARLEQHQQGHPNGAKFTRRFEDLEIIYQVEIGDRAAAQSLEFKFKKLCKKDKLFVIKNSLNYADLDLFLRKN